MPQRLTRQLLICLALTGLLQATSLPGTLCLAAPGQVAAENIKEPAPDAPENSGMPAPLKIALLVVAAGLLLAALWFGISAVLAYRRLKKSDAAAEMEPAAPDGLTIEDLDDQDPLIPTGPDAPVFQGQRSSKHFLAYNFSSPQLQRFLTDLEESLAGTPNSPYLGWEEESLATYITDVREEIATREA